MTKLSAFEGFMILAVAAVCLGMVWPRIAKSDASILAAKAQVLEMQIQGAYDLWKINGGVHGAGDPSRPEVLTQNLIKCLTSSEGQAYCSKMLARKEGKLILGRSGVYESKELSPGPSVIRIKELKTSKKSGEFSSKEGKVYRGVLLDSQFGVSFNNGKWVVVALK